MRLLFSLFLLSSFVLSSSSQETITGEYLVQLRNSNDEGLLVKNIESQGITDYSIRSIFPSLNIFYIRVKKDSDVLDLDIRQLLRQPFVQVAHPNRKVYNRNTDPNDPMYGDQWHLDRINAPAAWDLNTGGTNYRGDDVVVAVIDDGYFYQHEDLIDNIWTNEAEIDNDGIDNDNNNYIDDYYGLNVALPSAENKDDHTVNSHGTRVCGLIGAVGNNNIGVTGIIWDTKLMLVSGQTHEASIIESYNYVLDQRRRYNNSNGQEGAYVVATNSSFGVDNQYAENFPLWCDVYNALGEEGVLSIVATTNNNVDVDIEGDMPSTCTSDYIIAVTSLNISNELIRGFGSVSVDIGAPGEDILSTSTNNGYKNLSGTSAAVPVVTGAVSLLYSMSCSIFNEENHSNPGDLALQVKDAILNNVRPVSTLEGITTQEGMIDLFATQESLANGISGTTNAFSFCHLSPNPVDADVQVEYTVEGGIPHSLVIYNSIGEIVEYRDIDNIIDNTVSLTISMQDYANGIYVLSLQSENHTNSRKLLKK